MADISVKCSGLRSAADDLNECASLLANASQDVENVINTLHLSTNSLNSIKRSLRAQKTSITNEKYKCTRMAAVARQSASLYENTENKVAGHARVGKITIEDIISNIRNSVINDGRDFKYDKNLSFVDKEELEKLLKYFNISTLMGFPTIAPIPSILSTTLLFDLYMKLPAEKEKLNVKVTGGIDIVKRANNSKLSDNNIIKQKADKIKKHNDNNIKYKSGGYWAKGEDGKLKYTEYTEDELTNYKKSKLVKDITYASVGGNYDRSLISREYPKEKGILSGKAGFDVANFNANAQAYVGRYGAGASVGVGVSALSGHAEGKIGSEYNNVHIKGNVAVLEGKASADINVGLRDKDGNINPSLYGGVSAEANIVSAKGTVGGTIGGTELNVTGGVTVGVGGHADFGLKDGKLSVDVGASLGLGLSVKFDVDASKTVEYVVNNTEEIVDTVNKVADTTYKAASKVMDNIADGTSKAVNSLYKKSKAAWNSIW